MEKVSSSPIINISDDQFHIAISNVLDEYCERNAGKPIMSLEEIKKAGEYLLQRIDLKKADDQLSPEQRAHNALASLLYNDIIHHSEELSKESSSSMHDAFYSDLYADNNQYMHRVYKKVKFPFLKEHVSKMHMDDLSLLTCKQILYFRLSNDNYREDILLFDFYHYLTANSIESRVDNIKSKLDLDGLLCNNLTVEEYTTYILLKADILFSRLQGNIHEMHRDIVAPLIDAKVIDDLIEHKPFYHPLDKDFIDRVIDLTIQYIARLFDNYDSTDVIDFMDKSKLANFLLQYYYIIREYHIIRGNLIINRNDQNIWRNIAALQRFASSFENIPSLLFSINELMDMCHSIKSQEGRKKGWAPIDEMKEEAKKLAITEWKNHPNELHDKMASRVYDKLKSKKEYADVMRNYDNRYPNSRASYTAILKAVKEIAPTHCIKGMPGVKKKKT